MILFRNFKLICRGFERGRKRRKTRADKGKRTRADSIGRGLRVRGVRGKACGRPGSCSRDPAPLIKSGRAGGRADGCPRAPAALGGIRGPVTWLKNSKYDRWRGGGAIG